MRLKQQEQGQNTIFHLEFLVRMETADVMPMDRMLCRMQRRHWQCRRKDDRTSEFLVANRRPKVNGDVR